MSTNGAVSGSTTPSTNNSAAGANNNENTASSGGSTKSLPSTKTKKMGSLGLFFRKVRYLCIEMYNDDVHL